MEEELSSSGAPGGTGGRMEEAFVGGRLAYDRQAGGTVVATGYLPASNSGAQAIGVLLRTDRTSAIDLLRPESPLAVRMELFRRASGGTESAVAASESAVEEGSWPQDGAPPDERCPVQFGTAGSDCLVWTDIEGGYGREAAYFVLWDVSGQIGSASPYFSLGPVWFRAKFAWEREQDGGPFVWSGWEDEVPVALNSPPGRPTGLSMSMLR